MAATMVERVFGRLRDPRVVPQEFLFSPTLVERDSVARPPPAVRRSA
jgi:DNA-binding LacI/PurR family transcriptional regulator